MKWIEALGWTNAHPWDVGYPDAKRPTLGDNFASGWSGSSAPDDTAWTAVSRYDYHTDRTWTYGAYKAGYALLGGKSRGYPAVSADTTGELVLTPCVNGTPVTGIHDYAFENRPGLTALYIPEGVSNFTATAFAGCTNLKYIVTGSKPPFTSMNGIPVVYRPCTDGHAALWTVTTTPADYQTTGSADKYCLRCMQKVSTEILAALDYVYNGGPYTVQLENTYLIFKILSGKIKLASFHDYDACIDKGTTGRVVIPSHITWEGHDYPVSVVGDLAFYYCTNITEVVVPSTVTLLNYYTFSETFSLKRLIFEGDAPKVYNRALVDCPATIYVKPGSRGWDVPIPGTWYSNCPIEYLVEEGEEASFKSTMTSQSAATPNLTLWDCYVAGLNADATNAEFTTSITISNGVPRVTYTPDLGQARTYRTLGRKSLLDADYWTEVPEGQERGYNFFKVEVSMPE